MSKVLNINGAQYLPATEAGRHFGYTNDYVAKLAREKKILGTRVGRQWFVDPASLEHFIEEAKRRKNEHAKRLRIERREERLIIEEIKDVKGDRSQNILTLLKSGTIVGVGTLLGAFLFLFANDYLQIRVLDPSSIVSRFEHVAYDLYHIDVGNETTEQAALPASAVTSGSGGVAQEEAPTSLPPEEIPEHGQEGVIILKDDGVKTQSKLSELERSFSDEVIITKDADGSTGTIQPVFKNKDDETYRFLIVPVKDSDG